MRLDKEIDMTEYLDVKNTYKPVIKGLIQQQAELLELDDKLPKYIEGAGYLLKQFDDCHKSLDPKGIHNTKMRTKNILKCDVPISNQKQLLLLRLIL